MMGEVLGNSVSVMLTSNGFACQHHLYLYSSTSCGDVRICGFYPINGRRAWFGCIQFKLSPMNMLLGSPRNRMVESGMVCVDNEENNLIQREREDLLPPWGNLVFEPPSPSVCQPPRVSEKFLTAHENNIHFLEETDEEELSTRVLMLSRSNKVTSALELYKSMELAGLRPNVHGCNSLLSCLLRNRRPDDALRVFEFMKKNEITTGHTYSLILKAIANTQGCDAALGLFAGLENKDFDVIVYNTMIAICARVNNWVETLRIWICMKENGEIGTRVTYSLLVCTFVRCGQNELALDAYNEMVQNRLKPGNDTMQAMIGACTKEGKWDLALNVFQNMLNDGLKPNQVAYNALINSLGKAGEVELAFKVYGTMTIMGYRPDEYTWNALLGALYRAKRHADTLRLFETIKREQSSQLNVHLYNTVLMSCQKLGSWDRALQLLWQMEASGLSVPTASYNLVIAACETARKPKVALQVYEHMVHRKCTPDTFTHLSLLRSCIWGSLWTEVEEILDVAPNVSLYNAAIQGMCLRGKVESAKDLYTKMRKSGLKPDGKTSALMLQNLQKNSTKRNSYRSR